MKAYANGSILHQYFFDTTYFHLPQKFSNIRVLKANYFHLPIHLASSVFSGGAGGARATPEFGGSQKGWSLISAYQSLAITTNTPGFEKLNTALQ